MADVEVSELPPIDGTQTQPQTQLFDPPKEPSSPLFDPPAQQTGVNLNSDGQTKMTSTLAGFAQQMNDMSGQTVSQMQELAEDKIKNGQEAQLRTQIAEQYRQQQVSSLQQLQSEALRTNPSDYALKDAFFAESSALWGPQNQHALEENGTKVMQATNMSPQQSALSAFLGGAHREQADYTAKTAIFNSAIDKLKTEAANQGFLNNVADTAFEFTGLEDTLVDSHIIKGIGSFLKLPSTNINNQSNFLWSLSPKDFGAYLDQAVAHGRTMWGPGPTYKALLKLAGPNVGTVGQSPLSYNFWQYAAPASFIPVMKMAKFASGMARIVGNRGLSVDIATAGIAAKSLGVPSGMEHVQPIEASIAETLPSVSVPDTLSLARGDVGVVSDVADKLEALQKGAEQVKSTLWKTPRLQPTQLREALDRAVKDAELTYRDTPIADIKREIIPETVASDTEPFVAEAKPEEKFVQTKPSKAKEFIGVSNKGKSVPKPYIPSQAEIAEMDPDSIAMLNEQGELRPTKIEGATPKKGQPGRLKTTGQSSVNFTVDNDTDVDSLSHFNARGEIYPVEPVAPEKTFRTNPFKLMLDHELEVARLDREGAEAAIAPKAPETGDIGGARSIPSVVKSPSTGLYSLSFYVGKDQTTGGFLTREGAEAAAVRRGLAPAVHQTLDGNWYVRVNHLIPESGLATKAVEASDFPAVYRPSEYVKSLDGLSAMLHNEMRKGAVLSQQRYLNQVVGPYAKNIKRLSKDENRALVSVLRSGEEEHQWYSMPELMDKYNTVAGRLPTYKEQLAYYSAKELSDLTYHVFNNKLYVAKARRGIQTVTITNPEIGLDTGRMNGRVVPLEEAKGQNILIADDGSVSDGVRKDVELLHNTGHYKMVELESPVLHDDTRVKYVLSHDDSLKTEPLERQQLNYNPGGSREYANKWFVKQANYVDNAAGQRTWLDPLTHVTGPTRTSLQKWVDGMEEARQVYASDMSEAEKRLRIDRTPIESYDKFEKMVQDGKIHPGTKFETLFDKEDPAEMKRIGLNDKNLTDPEIRGEEGYYMSQARMYYGEKGEHLRDPNGNLAPVLNPLKTLRRAVYNAARTNALGDYNTKVIEDWSKAASPLLDHFSVSDNPSPYEIFMNGQLLDRGLSQEQQRLVSSLDIARNAHKRFMGMRDPDQTTKALWLKNLAGRLENKSRIGENIATTIYNRMSDNPISAIKELVFHSYFGFGNLGRFVLHATQAIGAMAIDPVRGLSAGGMAPLTAALVHVNRSDKLLDYVARKMGPELGMPVQDYKQMVQSLRYSGWLNIGGEVAQLDRFTDNWGGTVLSKGWDVVKKYGVLPFHAAIGLQRLMGYHMAWSMAKELMPAEDVFSPSFQGWVNNKADAITGNMTTASSAAWQKGAWGIPTQFMSWQARMFENLLPETFGGSKALTGFTKKDPIGQKGMYLFGQMVLWGSAGVPALGAGVDMISELYRQHTGQQIDADTHRLITKGLMDTLIHGFTGVDTDLASRAGLGDAFNRTIQGFAHGDTNPFLQFLGGPAYETGNEMVDKLSKFTTYMKAEQVDELTPQQFVMGLKDALPLVQAFKYDQKAYWAWKYHNIFDPKTDQPLLMNGTPEAEAVTQALGIPDVWEGAKYQYLQNEDDRKQMIDDVAKQIVKIRRNEFDAIDNKDQDGMNAAQNTVRVLMYPFRDQPLMSQQIAKRASELMEGGYSGSAQEQIINREYKSTGFKPAEANQ